MHYYDCCSINANINTYDIWSLACVPVPVPYITRVMSKVLREKQRVVGYM